VEAAMRERPAMLDITPEPAQIAAAPAEQPLPAPVARADLATIQERVRAITRPRRRAAE
jgi:hypothetical protein